MLFFYLRNHSTLSYDFQQFNDAGGSGRWAESGCSLTRDTSQRVVVCTCLKEGTYAIIEVRMWQNNDYHTL